MGLDPLGKIRQDFPVILRWSTMNRSVPPSDRRAGLMEVPFKPHCERRNELSEAVVDLSIRLSIAASQMADLAPAANTPAFAKAKAEVQRLRDEYENLRAEFERHRAQHGC